MNQAAAAQFGYPLSLWTYEEDLRGKLSSALYAVSRDGNQVTFEYSDADLAVRKVFSFDNTYVTKLETSVVYKGGYVAAIPAWPSGFGDQTNPAFYAASLIDYQYNKNIERLPIKKISGGATMPGPFHWAGPNDQYFAAIFIPDDPAATSMVTFRHGLPIAKDTQAKDSTEKINVELLGAAVGNIHGFGKGCAGEICGGESEDVPSRNQWGLGLLRIRADGGFPQHAHQRTVLVQGATLRSGIPGCVHSILGNRKKAQR